MLEDISWIYADQCRINKYDSQSKGLEKNIDKKGKEIGSKDEINQSIEVVKDLEEYGSETEVSRSKTDILTGTIAREERKDWNDLIDEEK